MLAFATGTGLTGPQVPRRYLWTDAFAVGNFLELNRRTGAARFQELAVKLVDQVHHVLGRHRTDDPRRGWISGLSQAEGKGHPTRAGLRIGKPLPERPPGEPLDERLEWDRDGQYYHYLTRWMHALGRMARESGDGRYLRWALELAVGVHAAFVDRASGDGVARLYWKMSIDLSRPLVASMGHHDPLDGYLTYRELQAGRDALDGPEAGPALQAETAELGALLPGRDWVTDDPLGLGGLLGDAYRLAQLPAAAGDEALLQALLEACSAGLAMFARHDTLNLPAIHRLAFRELGLAIGLAAVTPLRQRLETRPDLQAAGRLAGPLEPYAPLGQSILSFWLDPAARQSPTWHDHADINAVTLATTLLPDAYLLI
jgi:hypothetical protein